MAHYIWSEMGITNSPDTRNIMTNHPRVYSSSVIKREYGGCVYTISERTLEVRIIISLVRIYHARLIVETLDL